MDLRRKKAKQATDDISEQNVVDLPGLRGKLPFSSSKIILTPAEKKVMKEQFNWKEGDPVPMLSKLVKADVNGPTMTLDDAQKQMASIPLKEYDPETPNFVPPPVVSIESLPENKRKDIEEAIKAMKQQIAEEATRPDVHEFMPTDPSIAKAMGVAQQQVAKESHSRNKLPTVSVEDDRTAKQRATVVRPSASAKSETRPVPPPAPVKTVPFNNDPKEGSAELVKKNCQHCGWDLSKDDAVEPTDADKRVYTAAMLGNKRFVKVMQIFGGRAKVVFRSMTTTEYDWIIRQLHIDGVKGRVRSPAEVFRKAQEYQLAVCLESIHSEDNAINLPTIDKYTLDEEDEESTGLPEVLEHVYATAVSQDSLRRILFNKYAEFDNLLSKIEAIEDKEGF